MIKLNSKQLKNPIVGTFEGDFTGNFTGDLQGTASYALNTGNGNLNTIFVKNQTDNISDNTIKTNQNLFNHDSLIVQSSDTLLIESGAEYFILGDLINSGSIIVSGSLIVNGSITNIGSIVGPGTILSNNVIVTYDKANIPYGFVQLDGSNKVNLTGSFTGSFVGDGSGLTNLIIYTGSFATTGSNIFYGTQVLSGSNSSSLTIGQLSLIDTDSFDIRASNAPLSLTSNTSSIVGASDNGSENISATIYQTTGFPISAGPIAATILAKSGSNQKAWLHLDDGSSYMPGDVNIGYEIFGDTTSGSLNISNGNINVTGSIKVTNGITGSLYGTASYATSAAIAQDVVNKTFLRNQTTSSILNIIRSNESIFNPSNLLILNNDIFIIESNAEYYVLGDLINSGSLIVSGTIHIGGALFNNGIVIGSGIIE